VIPTSQSDQSSAAICRARGWEPGQLLLETTPERPEIARVIRITAVGHAQVLAIDVREGNDREWIWTLNCRDWRAPTAGEAAALAAELDPTKAPKVFP
jgi:hypothetical protein